MLTVEVIQEVDALREFQPEWAAFTQTLGLTPFQQPRWMLTWWSHLGSGELRVIVFRDGNLLVGVVPCFLHTWNRLRQLTLIGSGISDYLDPAISPQHSTEILDRLRLHLIENRGWQICDWQDLSSDTPLKALRSCAEFEVQVTEDTPCSRIPLIGTFEEFVRSRPKKLRRNLRQYRQRAEAVGEIQFQVHGKADAESIEALIALHTARWREAGEAGSIESNGSAEFLRDAATEFEREDMLRLFTLRFKGRIAAVMLALRNADTMFDYLTAFDPEHHAFGFGRTLISEALRYSYEQQFTCWDFLRGDEPYKFWWGAQEIPKWRIRLTRKL